MDQSNEIEKNQMNHLMTRQKVPELVVKTPEGSGI